MDSAHIVKSFDDDLGEIGSLISEMGGLVEAQIFDAVTTLATRDKNLGEKVVANDILIDNLEMTIDSSVVRILALRQPVAEDLRAVISVLKVASHLERVGDYAKNIAKRSSVIGDFQLMGSSLNVLRRMSRIVQEMLKDVLDSYSARDSQLAVSVRQRDEEVDQMHNTLFRELLTYMMEDPRNITPCMHLLFVGKNLERMGDHTTGIAEQVHYIVTGAVPEIEREKSDFTSLTSLGPNDANGSDSAAS